MAQRDRIGVDENLFHQESKDLLALAHVQRIGASPQLPAECGQAFGQLQILSLVHRRHLQGLEFRLDGLRLFPQIRHTLAKLG